MLLDLRTIYFIVAVSCFVLGILQLAAYATGRFERWPLWWGLSNLLVGVGSFLVALRNLVPYAVSVDGGNIVTIAGYMLMFFAVRVFSGRALDQRTFWLAILLVSVPVVLIVSDPSSVSARLLYVSVICCLCDLAVARRRSALSGARGFIRQPCLSASTPALRGSLRFAAFSRRPVRSAGRILSAAVQFTAGWRCRRSRSSCFAAWRWC